MTHTRLHFGLTAALLFLTACGGGGSSSTPTPPTSPPVVTNSAPTVATENADQNAQVAAAFSYDATQSGSTFTDADGDTLSYTVSFSVNIPGLTSSGGTISGTPSQAGTVTVTITANDGNGGEASDSFDITIAEMVTASGKPNIIFVLSDDQGKDSSAEYDLSTDLPSTPNLSALANNGVIFENAWVAPTCSPTRAALLTGKHARRTNVLQPGDDLPGNEVILPAYLKTNTSTSNYASAMVGKWHLGGGSSGPNDFGIDYFAGILNGSIPNYFNWNLTVNGVSTTETSYATSALTDLAIDWVEDQTTPWFLWLSYNAPHTPYHLPPTDLHARNLSGTQTDIDANPRDYYLAAIEAMDTEFGRLWNSLDTQERANTIVIYLGDNGTPRSATTTTPQQSGAKGGLLQGGINTPFFMSGPGITRMGEREDALVNHTDLFATIAELAGADLDAFNDGQSFADLLTDSNSDTRDYAFTEYSGGWAIRNNQFKLIETSGSDQDLYDLFADPAEQSDLLDTGMDVSSLLSELEQEAAQIRDITNITGAKFADVSPNCADYIGQYNASAKDVLRGGEFEASIETRTTGNTCTLSSNSIPNHDFNDGETSFANAVGEVAKTYSFPTTPTLATTKTPLDRFNNAVLLNGVKVDILSAGCFGVGDGRTGCNDPDAPWRYDPMHAPNGFQVDQSNAHAQPNGGYHYHGPPPVANGDASTVSGVIGYAADGFPIYGPFFDDSGVIRRAESSFRLKSGTRPTGPNDPGGLYDGQFRADYEYVSGLGDLDECNGMTVDGQYRYHVTEAFPYIISCFSGTPDQSFNK
ncbi:MAG: sulfatase-like hydrolase/transferase [Litorimonas sp.]